MKRARRVWPERCFRALCLLAVVLPLVVLGVLIVGLLIKGLGRLDWAFVSGSPSGDPERAGIYPALVGTLWVVGLTALVALPVGVGAAIFLQEYRSQSRFARLIELNIATLAGVPSVLFGLLGLEVFVRVVGLGDSVLAGACTLALLALPLVVLSSREALRAVPDETRRAAAALGATPSQIIWRLVFPAALPGILTGVILAISRVIGETAPLLLVGALALVTIAPDGLGDAYTVLPVQIFDWLMRPGTAFAANAAAGIVVLLSTMLVLSGAAVAVRHRARGRLS